MTRSYSPRDFHDRPLATIAFEDGTKWVIRFPKASDRHLLTDIGTTQRTRLTDFKAALDVWKAEILAKAKAATEAAGGDDEAGRAVLDDAEMETPENLSMDYWHAEVLAAFISPLVTPEEVLERLGNEYDLDFMYERHAELMDTMEGNAAKKRVRGAAVR